MATAVISDLHLGLTSNADVLRRPGVVERVCESLAGADRLVLLGDTVELRERRAEETLERAAPVLRALGEAMAGREIVLVAGNHDYELVAPALERARLDGRPELPLSDTYAADPGDLADRVIALFGDDARVTLAYPGLWLRDDVFALHGHYADLYLTVPRVESVFAHAIARLVGANGPDRVLDRYESVLAPLYSFSHSIAQSARVSATVRGGDTSRRVWQTASGKGIAGFAIGGVAIPAASAVLTRLRLGTFRGDISPVELRRAGLRAMAQVVDELDIGAAHVIFGHTHRAGPLPGEAEGWFPPGGVRLHNTGNWALERAFGAADGPSNPYWPGRITWVGDEGPPHFENVLEGYDFGAG